jgi:hypothetical protein
MPQAFVFRETSGANGENIMPQGDAGRRRAAAILRRFMMSAAR